MQLRDYIQLQLFFGAAKSFCSSSQRNFVMELEKRILSKVLSNNGLDIRQDVDAARQASDFEFVKLDEHNKKMAALENALRTRMCRSFIAGAVFGVLIMVAIILGVVSLSKIGTTKTDLDKMKEDIRKLNYQLKQKVNSTTLEDKLRGKLSKSNFSIEFEATVTTDALEKKLCNNKRLPKSCLDSSIVSVAHTHR